MFWLKGVLAWVPHALFVVLGVAHLARRGTQLYERAMRWLLAGIVICAAYGVVQLAAQALAGVNLDAIVVAPLTFGQGKSTGINIYGQVQGTGSIYRVNALTGDPNHLGVFLCLPLMLFLPVYLADTRARRKLGVILAFLFLVQVLTLSRSAALGDIVGLAVLLPYVRHILPRMRTIVATVGGFVALVCGARPHQPLHPHGDQLAHQPQRRRRRRPLPVLPARPARARSEPAVRDGVQHVRGVLRVRHRQGGLRAAQLLDRDAGRDRDGRAHRLPRLLRLRRAVRPGDAAQPESSGRCGWVPA